MARCPFAIWRGADPSNYRSGRGHVVIGMTVHHADASLASADGYFRSQHEPGHESSACFGVDFDGTLYQWVDTDDADYHACQAQYEGYVGCENASDPARPDDPPTDAQIAMMAKLALWLGVPPFAITARGQAGIGYHTQFPGPCGEAWGQTACPGQGFIASIPKIVAAMQGAPAQPKKDDDPMLYVFNPHAPSEIWCLAGNTRRHVTPDEWGFAQFVGQKAIKVSAAWFDGYPVAA